VTHGGPRFLHEGDFRTDAATSAVRRLPPYDVPVSAVESLHADRLSVTVADPESPFATG
jgi:hypothetical protein